MKHARTIGVLASTILLLGAATAASAQPSTTGSDEQPGVPLELTYLGAAGWRISDGNVVVLVDPWPSRLKYTGRDGHPDDTRPNFARTDIAYSDTDVIDAVITEADFILVQHGHLDHLGELIARLSLR